MNMRIFTQLGTVAMLVLLGGCEVPESAESSERGGLLFGLEDADVEQIHADYLEEEGLEVITGRLTAPFDCSLYGDLCDLVGPDGAETLTGEVVELALDGVPVEDIDAHIDTRVDVLAADDRTEDDEIVHRGQSPYSVAVSASGTHRIRAKSGVFTPAVGSRRAWTKVVSESNSFGAWVPHQATQLCVDAGTSTQTKVEWFEGLSPVETPLESLNPIGVCIANAYNLTSRSYHQRNTGVSIPATPDLPAFYRIFRIRSVGSATGVLAGSSLSLYSPGHTEYF